MIEMVTTGQQQNGSYRSTFRVSPGVRQSHPQPVIFIRRALSCAVVSLIKYSMWPLLCDVALALLIIFPEAENPQLCKNVIISSDISRG